MYIDLDTTVVQLQLVAQRHLHHLQVRLALIQLLQV